MQSSLFFLKAVFYFYQIIPHILSLNFNRSLLFRLCSLQPDFFMHIIIIFLSFLQQPSSFTHFFLYTQSFHYCSKHPFSSFHYCYSIHFGATHYLKHFPHHRSLPSLFINCPEY